MSNSIKKYVDLFNEFSKESFKWCAEESEKATSRVSQILDIIVEDADRVSQMSADTLKALDTMKEIITSLSSDNRNIEKANKLSVALTKLSNENMEVQGMIQPMLEALQFQDRITQNMENLSKMVSNYVKVRESVESKGSMTEAELQSFGEELLKLTTMADERDLVRKHIDGLSNDEQVTDMIFF